MSISSITPVGLGNSISSIKSITDGEGTSTASVQPEDPASSFKNVVKKAIKEVNNLQDNSDQMAVKLASGDSTDVHQAMIAMQKAKLALDLTIQVRNKVIDAYSEIMRMQI